MQAYDHQELATLIVSKLQAQLPEPVELTASTPLASLGVDSIGMVLLVAELEGTLDFTFEPEDLDMVHFTTVATLANLLADKYQLLEVAACG